MRLRIDPKLQPAVAMQQTKPRPVVAIHRRKSKRTATNGRGFDEYGRNNTNNRAAATGSVPGDPASAGDRKRDAPLDAEQPVRVRGAFASNEGRRAAGCDGAIQRRSG